MSGAPWILKTFQVDETGMTGAHVFIEARQPGLFGFILNLIGLDPTAQLKVTKGSVSFRATSLSGMVETSTSLTQVGSFQGGYSKPIIYIIMAPFMLILGITFDIILETLGFTFLGLLLSLICVILYALQKNLAFGFETSGGAYYGMSFKRGILNNVSVDIEQVEHALLLVNALIGSATLGTDYALSSNVQKVSSQTTIISTPPPNQSVVSKESQVYSQAEIVQPEQSNSNQDTDEIEPLSVAQSMPSQTNDAPHPSRIILYQKIMQLGYNIGSFEDFNDQMVNEQSRQSFYLKAVEHGIQVGTWEDFNSQMS